MKKLISYVLLAAAFALPVAYNVVNAEKAYAVEGVSIIELQDGTKLQIDGLNVYVLGLDGKLTPVSDGTHTAKDGSKIVTKNGKLS